MPSAEEALRRYSTPFQRHLSFFDRNDDGFVHFGEALRGNLSIGLDFPVAVAMAMGYIVLYGNTRSTLFGPFNPIEISRVYPERDMLQKISTSSIPAHGVQRKDLVRLAQPSSLMNSIHVSGLWAFAANREGYLSSHDIGLFQQGTMLYELERRRKDNRNHVLPLYRGGPIWVGGHSYFVDKLFGVKVYQETGNEKQK